MSIRFIRNRKRLVAAGVVVLGLAAGGAATAASIDSASTSQLPPPITYVSTSSSPAAPVSASAAVAQVLQSMAGSDIVSARVGSPPSDAPPPNGSPAIPALYATVQAPSEADGQAIEPLWEADLLEGAVVELAGSSSALTNDLGDVYFSVQLPGGTTVPIGGGIGNIARGQQFTGANESDATIQSSIENTVSAYGLTLDSLHIFHALGAAPAVVVTAPDVAKIAAKYQSLVSDIFGSPPRYEGYYLEIRGTDGKAYVRASASFISGAGRTWLDPSVDGTGQLPKHF